MIDEIIGKKIIVFQKDEEYLDRLHNETYDFIRYKAKQEVFDDFEKMLENIEDDKEWSIHQLQVFSEIYTIFELKKEKHLHPITDKETSNDDSKKVKSV